jgi:hypothetical protein
VVGDFLAAEKIDVISSLIFGGLECKSVGISFPNLRLAGTDAVKRRMLRCEIARLWLKL